MNFEPLIDKNYFNFKLILGIGYCSGVLGDFRIQRVSHFVYQKIVIVCCTMNFYEPLPDLYEPFM